MKYTYRAESVKCGKAGCSGCPHGPYWYAYWREGGKVRKRYCGRDDPRVKGEQEKELPKKEPKREQDRTHPHDAIFSRAGGSIRLAYEILGLALYAGPAELQRTYQKLVLEHHPDRFGDEKRFKHIQGAWDYLERAGMTKPKER